MAATQTKEQTWFGRNWDTIVNIGALALFFGLGVMVSRWSYIVESLGSPVFSADPGWWDSFLQNFGTEMFGGALTFLILGIILGARDQRRERKFLAEFQASQQLLLERQQYQALKSQLSSTVRGFPAEAVRLLRHKMQTDARWVAFLAEEIESEEYREWKASEEAIKTAENRQGRTAAERGLDWIIGRGLAAGGDFTLARLSEKGLNDRMGTVPGWAVNLAGIQAEGAKLAEAMLTGANLSGADLWSANLSGAGLRRANLSGAVLWSADLSGTSSSYADLSGADLRHANLSGAMLRRANLSGVGLQFANLSGASLVVVDLSGADLTSANLSGAILQFANLSGAQNVTIDQLRDVFEHRGGQGNLLVCRLPDDYILPDDFDTWKAAFEEWVEHIVQLDENGYIIPKSYQPPAGPDAES